MASPLEPPLRPRQGVILNVLGICRISTVHQDLHSLDDQEALLRRFIAQHYDGSVNFRFIKSQDSGEYLDREELFQAEEQIEKRQHDVVICEDLARICRRHHAVSVCELCEDKDTRLIALNDNIDTARSDWRMNAMFSAFKHESYNKDTSQRIRRTLRNRFTQGGIVQTTIFGYVKPPGAKSDADLQKDPAAKPVYDEMFRRLEEGANFSEIADWLNKLGIPPGPYCRTDRWDCAMVGRVVRNPILKGIRVRNKKMSRRINKTGRRRSVDAPPEERLERNCPHLAFIEPSRFDRVNDLLTRRNAKFKRLHKDGVDPRKDVPKKKTRWPGQHVDCGICNRPYRYGGHGQTDHLMCGGAYEYCCWNGVSVDGPLAAEKLMTAIVGEINALPDYDNVLTDLMEKEIERLRSDQAGCRTQLEQKRNKLERELANIRAALRQAGPSNVLIEELKNLESQQNQIRGEIAALDRVPKQMIAIPPLKQIKSLALRALTSLARTSFELGRLMQRLISRIRVHPYRLCDGGRVVLRARFSLDLVTLVPEARGLDHYSQALRRELVVDLFDPPQRVKYRERVVALTEEGLTQREIASRLGITQPAVQHAAALTREMEERGLTDPYVPMVTPPVGDTKLRRHHHPRYQFRPREEVMSDDTAA
jgi:DNA invertase Pin-like site-specific DNA recombinase